MTNTVTFLNMSEQQIYGEIGLVIIWVIEQEKVCIDGLKLHFRECPWARHSNMFYLI